MVINGRTQVGPAPSLVYLVDDDAGFREEMVLGLTRLGLDAHGYDSAGALYRAFAARRPDTVVIDIGLPDEDGLSVANHLRTSPSLGIIMAAGRSEVVEGVKGLEKGAHAYLVKPVDVQELAATVVALKQRLSGNRPSPGEKHWTLDQGGWVLSDGLGHELRLTASERHVLECLFGAKGEIVGRPIIIQALGGNIYDFNYTNLDTIVSRLRQRAKKSGMVLPLQVVRGSGFAFTE